MMSPTSMNPSEKQQYSSNNSNAMPSNDLLDLLGGLGSEPITTSSTTTTTVAPNDNSNTNGINILSMLPNTLLSPTTGNNILSSNLFDDLTGNSNSNISGGIDGGDSSGVKITALDKNGLNITLVPNKSVGDGCLRVIMLASNNSLNTLEQYLFQAAVPKSFTLQMLSPSGSVLPPGGTISQEMRLTSSSKVYLCSYMDFFLFNFNRRHTHHIIFFFFFFCSAHCECGFVYRM